MNTLCIMIKAPAMGRVKTRLAREVGAAAAVAAYRTMTAELIRRLNGGREWRLILAVAPDAALATRAFPAKVRRIAQGGGDLGGKMQRVMDRLRRNGPVAIVGSDIPAIGRKHIRAAFKALAANDAVIGPSEDGGYWLIGCGRRRRIAPFANVAWSTDRALAGTMANLKGARVGILPVLPDIDTAADWRDWTRKPLSVRRNGL
jgi:hypothetical protein